MERHGGFMVPLVIPVLHYILAIESATSVLDTTCSFENGLCGWTSVNLTLSQYPNVLANSNKSGPKQAQDGEFYVYLDTSNSVNLGNLTRESLMVPTSSGDICLRFWYHMFGETMGILDVLIDDTVMWTKSGNQSDAWHCATVEISTLQSKISFLAKMGRDIYSIIALDNIEALNTKCIQENCESLHDLTTSTTQSSQPPTSQQTTQSQPDVATPEASTKINLEEYIPYIAGVPAAILVIGAIILCVCLRKSKRSAKHRTPMIVPPNQYDDLPNGSQYDYIDEKREEIYDDLDEKKMIQTVSESNPYDDADTNQSSGQTNQGVDDYEEPSKSDNQGRKEHDYYITPTNKRSDVPSSVYVKSDDDYITPTNEPDGPRKMSTRTESINLHDIKRASIVSAEAVVDNDYLELRATQGKKGGSNLAFSLKE